MWGRPLWVCLETRASTSHPHFPTQLPVLTRLGWRCDSVEWNVLFDSTLRQAWGRLGLWRYENPTGREREEVQKEREFQAKAGFGRPGSIELRPGTVILSGSFSES